MTDITALIGPLPEPTPAPKFPTPWDSIGNAVRDAHGVIVFRVPLTDTIPYGEDKIARFIAEAVNEKVARDSGADFKLPECATFRHDKVQGDRVIITDNDGDEWHELEPGRFWAHSASPGDSAEDYREEEPGEWVSRESIEDMFGIRSERAL